MIESKLAHKDPYIISIGDKEIRLPKLQNNNKEAKKLRSEKLSKGWEDIKKLLYYQGLPYIPNVICLELISKHYNNLF